MRCEGLRGSVVLASHAHGAMSRHLLQHPHAPAPTPGSPPAAAAGAAAAAPRARAPPGVEDAPAMAAIRAAFAAGVGGDDDAMFLGSLGIWHCVSRGGGGAVEAVRGVLEALGSIAFDTEKVRVRVGVRVRGHGRYLLRPGAAICACLRLVAGAGIVLEAVCARPCRRELCQPRRACMVGYYM